MNRGNGPMDSATYPDLAGKIAVVTGGSRGIGAVTARALARNDVAVAVVARDGPALSAVADGIHQDGGRALAVAADCTVAPELARVRDRVHDEFGPVDILVPFAGGAGMPVPTVQESAEHWRMVVDSELTSAFATISAFLADMTGGRGGTIVTMSSAAARQAAQSSAAYAAAKAGVIALTRHLARELAPDVRVNCVAPAAVENDRMRAAMTDEQLGGLGASFPLGRIGQPADVAAAVLFLASQASSWITGATLDIAGGKVMV